MAPTMRWQGKVLLFTSCVCATVFLMFQSSASGSQDLPKLGPASARSIKRKLVNSMVQDSGNPGAKLPEEKAAGAATSGGTGNKVAESPSGRGGQAPRAPAESPSGRGGQAPRAPAESPSERGGRAPGTPAEVPSGVHPPPPGQVIPSKEVLERMSHKELQAFYHSYVNSPQETCSWVERMGLITDGGWEHCDDPRWSCNPDNCLVYSYGIAFDFSYDDDMAKFGCEVHAFDPSMKTQSHLRGTKVHFHNAGVAATDKVLTRMGDKNDQTWQLYSIETQRKLLNHTAAQRRIDVVKMDVEGYELESLSAALDAGMLDDVRQLNFESHVSWHDNDPTREEYLKFLELFRKVYDRGFRIYLTHRNYVYSAFKSSLYLGKKRVKCHEVHTVNINLLHADWAHRLTHRHHRMQQIKKKT